MFRHVAMFRWTEDTTDEQRREVERRLSELQPEIPDLVTYHFGHDVGLNEGNSDFVVVADFESVDGYIRYRDHPKHRTVIEEVIVPIAAQRGAVQYEIAD